MALLVATACETTPKAAGNGAAPGNPNAGSAGSQNSAEAGEFGPGGNCDIQALLAAPANGCTNAGCHGERFQGGLDLLSPGVDQRLVGVSSQTDACSGELLVDPQNIDNSLLLRVIDPARFKAAPCGVMMPFGSQTGVSADTLHCIEGWVRTMADGAPASTDDPAKDFEPVAPASYVNKVKTLLVGSAATADEVASVTSDEAALKGLIQAWLQTPEFEEKLSDFLQVALQQKLVGTFDSQFQRLRGNAGQLSAFKENAQESFVRTALDIVEQGRPFTEVLTTHRFAATTALLSGLAYLDRTETELKGEKHTIVREPTADMPPAPLPLDYSVQNHVWQIASLPVDCDPGVINADSLFEMMLGFVQCKGQGAGQYRFPDSVLSDADFSDWRFVDVNVAQAAKAVPTFYDVASLRSVEKIALRQPRVGFFTTPAFLANWETNEDNQFRVTTSQTVITALGKIFSPADATTPVRLDGLAKEHAAPNSTCYGCHQFLDPMREYFAQGFSYDFQRPEKASTITPSFAFQGYVHDGGALDDFAQALADHPGFATGWTQKLCYWANSQPCSEKDPEFLRVAQAFKDSSFNLKTLLTELLASPLVTGAAFTETFRTQQPFVSITRKQHLCRALDARLGVPGACGVATAFAGLVPEDDFSRGAAEPVQTAVTGLFHYAAVEKLCSRLATKLVGSTDAMPFQVKAPDAALDAFVEKLMGLGVGTPRHDSVRQSLGEHFDNAKSTTNATTALRSAFIVACVSPEVQALGL
ncbi:MAG TPA: hypothetical protein VHB79_03095 [Polyangiaceae bacterium]|nr:hypothetical protein [Polyangiaceae bacterium]